MFGKVVVDNQRILALLHEILAYGGPGVGRDVVERRLLVSGRVDYYRVVHCPVLLKRVYHPRYSGVFLSDGDVDALHACISLGEYRVHGDDGLAGLAVAQDQLTLAAPDRDHRVYGFDAGLHRSVDILTTDDPRRNR